MYIIVFGRTVDEVIARLEIVLKRLGEFNLKLKPSKYKLFQTKVCYLGHIVSEDGVEPDPGKIEGLKEWLQHSPKSHSELQTFVGFAGYYRCFIEGFRKIARLLHSLIGQSNKKEGPAKSKAPFLWIAECQAAFETLIAKLTIEI